MSVYVDQIMPHGGSKTFRWKKSCHMFADTPEELHALAAKIGMRREWFQNDERLPHYDLTESRRALAVRHGAVEVGHRETYAMMRRNAALRREFKIVPK
jgi:hypothetical protein